MIHNFFRSIGFSELKQNIELYKLLETVIKHPDEQSMAEDADGNEIACFSKNIGDEMGITVVGCFVNDEEFRMEYYYPYFRGSHITTYELVELERHAAKEAYMGICDELKLGVTLIFYINNVMDVIHENRCCKNNISAHHTVLSGLGFSGKILLPVSKTQKQTAIKQKSAQKRMNLIQQAREGDRGAMEDLTMNDIDVYSSLSRRIIHEDILTIVESSFIPYGVESDQYTIIGEILNCYKIKNQISKESVWILSLLCNELQFDICINEKDLYGEPEIGRRFKGRIWLQGYLNFGF